MKRTLAWWPMLLAFGAASCGRRPAPATAPVPRRVDSPSVIDDGAPIQGNACAFGGGVYCALPAVDPSRRDSAAAAFARGWMALHSAGVDRFAADHPAWDGRGVLIAILDSGIDPGIPGLGVTSDSATKILDLRDFSGEGRIALRPVIRRGDTLFIGDRHLLGASRVAAMGNAVIWGGALVETMLGKAPAADLNGNGNLDDTLLVVVTKTTSGWALFADTDGDGTLANERPIHDYAVAHEFFGWHQHLEGSAALAPAPVNLAANFADSSGTPVLDLFFDTSSHGTHVSGIAAGHNLYGVPDFDGVAPGARLIGLKIADDAHGAVTVTGSMVRALEYAIAFAHDRAMPLVVNLSFGVGNEVEGTARIDALIDSILGAHPDVVMTVAAGNDGPGLSTLGFPGSASRIISVGATLPPAFLGADRDSRSSELVAPFSSRGGEVAGPDIVTPGMAYSTVPNYAVGQEQESGTSMASPYAAGLAARLLSGLIADRRSAPARIVRQALRMGATPLPSGGVIDEGAGLPDLTAAWQWLAASHDDPDLAVDVGTVSARGGIYLTATPVSRGLGARVILRREDSQAALTLRLRSSASWLQFPETVALTNGRGEFTVRVQPAATAEPGVRTATIRLEGADETARALAIVPVVVRTAIPATGTRVPIPLAPPAGGVGRAFVPSDTGRGLQIEVATLRAADHVTAELHEPGGMPFRDGPSLLAGSDEGAALFQIDARDAASGLYEVDAVAGPLAATPGQVTVHLAPVRLGAVLLRDTLRVTAKSLVNTSTSVRLRAGLIGAERDLVVRRSDDAPVRLVIPVPAWANHVVVDTRMPRDAWSRFTDFGLSFLDHHGREFDASPINYAFGRATPDLPDRVVGDTMIVLLSPAFADPDYRGDWSLDVSIRFYVVTPYSLDAGGSPFKPVMPGALREERFVPGPMPIALPPEFLPLITVVALEGSQRIWTRELTIARPAAP